jgi:hypothetical protein
MSTWKESDPNSSPTRERLYATVDNGDGTFSTTPVAATVNASGLAILSTTAGGGGGGGPVAPTAAGTSATTANPVQGVTGGIALPVSGVFLGTNTTPTVSVIRDGTSNNQVTVSQFHNNDNQQPGGTAFGLLTGGVAQLLNAVGNLNRQTETTKDGITNRGIATGAQQMASPFATTTATTIAVSATTATIVVAASSGTNRGTPWAIQVGHIILLGTDPAYVTSVSGTSIGISSQTGGFAAHSGTTNVTGFVFNQARDASLPDGSLGTGIGASATELFNAASNAGAGGWEAERSAAGELDGATGVGTAVAAEYEYNGGGGSGANSYDRARNIQGKGLGSTTLSVLSSIGATSFTLTAVTGLLPGSPIYLEYNTGNSETLYIVSSYVPGTLTVTTQSAASFAHAVSATVIWDVYTNKGPGTNGILPTGIGLEEDVVYNPIDGKFYLEISATADGNAPANVPLLGQALWNGTTFDRLKGDSTGAARASLYGKNTVAGDTAIFVNTDGSLKVGGKTSTTLVTPTIVTTAYAVGNVVGGLFTFTNALQTAQSGMLQSVRLSIKSVQTVGFKLYIFGTNPSNTTWTDHAAPAINAADVNFLIDVIPFSSADSGLGTHTTYAFDGIGKAFNAASTSLYGILVTTGAPTFASVSDITIAINILQD